MDFLVEHVDLQTSSTVAANQTCSRTAMLNLYSSRTTVLLGENSRSTKSQRVIDKV